MHTPAHLVLNLTVLGKRNTAQYLLPVSIGALLPDAPMFVLYFVERVIFETPNQIIWCEAYFDPGGRISSIASIPFP